MEKHPVCFQSQLRFFAGGNVLFDRHEMSNGGIGVPDGSNGHFFVIQAAVLALVDKLAMPGLTRSDGAPKMLVKRVVLQ